MRKTRGCRQTSDKLFNYTSGVPGHMMVATCEVVAGDARTYWAIILGTEGKSRSPELRAALHNSHLLHIVGDGGAVEIDRRQRNVRLEHGAHHGHVHRAWRHKHSMSAKQHAQLTEWFLMPEPEQPLIHSEDRAVKVLSESFSRASALHLLR